MGLYFRKSKSIGPFRLNMSKSGLGVSTGVKGARLSAGPRGTYINIGRNGLYYRQKIGGKKGTRRGIQSGNTYIGANTEEYKNEIHASESQADCSALGRELTIIQRNIIILTLTLILCIFLMVIKKIAAGMILMALSLVFFLPRLSTRIMYNLDEEASSEWNKCVESLYALRSSKKVWFITSSLRINNQKTNAGAARTVKRVKGSIKLIRPRHITEFRVNADIKL